jgi:hypothetical protein
VGKSQRIKGRAWEQAVAREFRAALPDMAEQIKRGWQSRAGHDAPDVDVPGLWVECKAHRKCDLVAALAQAEVAAAGTGRVPVAICKDDRQRPTVTMYHEDFYELVRELFALRAR